MTIEVLRHFLNGGMIQRVFSKNMYFIKDDYIYKIRNNKQDDKKIDTITWIANVLLDNFTIYDTKLLKETKSLYQSRPMQDPQPGLNMPSFKAHGTKELRKVMPGGVCLNWDEVIKGLKEKSIDFNHLLSKTDSLNDLFKQFKDMPQAYVNISEIIKEDEARRQVGLPKRSEKMQGLNFDTFIIDDPMPSKEEQEKINDKLKTHCDFCGADLSSYGAYAISPDKTHKIQMCLKCGRGWDKMDDYEQNEKALHFGKPIESHKTIDQKLDEFEKKENKKSASTEFKRLWRPCCECGEVFYFDEKKDILCGSCEAKIKKHNQKLLKQLDIEKQPKSKRKVKAWVYLIWFEVEYQNQAIAPETLYEEMRLYQKSIYKNDLIKFQKEHKSDKYKTFEITNFKLLRKEYDEV